MQRDDAPPMRPLTARFVDPALEAEFLADSFELSTRRFTRFSVPLSIVVFLAYGVHDAFVVPEIRALAWMIRYGIFVPVSAALLTFMWSRFYVRFQQAAMLVFGTSLVVIVLWIGALSPAPAGAFIYTSYAVLFVTLGPFIARMNVVTQVVYTLTSLALYNVFAEVGGSALVVRLSLNLTIFALGGIGTLVAWQLELQARESFLQRRLIRAQVKELDLANKKSDALLLNILPAKIAERLKAENRPIADGFSDVTVLFSDIVGFTKMSERLSPQDLVKRLNAIFSSFDDLADQLGLEKIKTIGDAYMVVGGLRGNDEQHADLIADMALGMLDRVAQFGAEFGEDLTVRIGIHSGPVVGGVIGKKKFVYDVWGDTVNTASRMESHSDPGTIQVTYDTYARLADRFVFQSRGTIDVKGKGPMYTYALLGRVRAES